MKAFDFPLAKVLHWRSVQLELEENRLKQNFADLAQVDRERAALDAAAVRAELQVREWSPLDGRDLAALAAFRRHVQNEEAALAGRRAECERKLAMQHQAVLEARRRCRLLERLKERRLADWRVANDRELEQLASELHLAGLVRRRG